jgi:hypothetical protein
MYVGIKCVHQENKSHHCLEGSCLIGEFVFSLQQIKLLVNQFACIISTLWKITANFWLFLVNCSNYYYLLQVIPEV